MGYLVKKNIAEITAKPNKVSLSSDSNFIEFSSLNNSTIEEKVDIYLSIKGGGIVDKVSNTSDEDKEEKEPKISITEKKSNVKHTFEGTESLDKLNDRKFYTFNESDNATPYKLLKSAESIRECLMKNSFLRSNFHIELIISNGKPAPQIHIESKGVGKEYEIEITSDNSDFIDVSGSSSSNSYDSISAGYSNSEIQLFIQKNTGVFLGENAHPNNKNMGSFFATLSKSYSGKPIWIDTNVLKDQIFSNTFLRAESWCNTGTVQDYRFYAKRYIRDTNRYENDLFYYSDVLYNISGYKRNLEEIEMYDYIYCTDKKNVIKPLTNQPELFHIKGQSQYFNFILSDPNHNEGNTDIALCYELFTSSKEKISTEDKQHSVKTGSLNIVNTIKLNLDQYINDGKVGYVEVSLTANNKKISYPLCFNILPTHLYKVNDFAFLNSLGGWSSFNFAGAASSDFKTSAKTIFKTHTPYSNISNEIESVYSKEVKEKFSVQTMPITLKVYEWLKELSTSIAVYELSTKRYIVVDELNIKPNTKDDLFTLEMKYHYSDSYNATIK